MDELKQQSDQSHLLSEKKPNPLPLILAGFVLVLAAAYAGLCFYVSMSNKILPNVRVGETAVGGMTVAAAANQIEAQANDLFSSHSIEVTYGDKGSLTVPGSYIAADGHNASLAAYQAGRSDSFFLYGVNFLKALVGASHVDLPVILNPDFPQGNSLLDNAFRKDENPVTQPSYTIGETEIQVTKGISGYQYDQNTANQLIMQAIVDAANGEGPGSVHVEPIRTEPSPIDWQAIANQIFTAPADASLNAELGEIVPSVTGVSLDVTQAEQLYRQAGEGELFSVPFTFTQPAMTTEELASILFKDVLGQADSYISGVANRVSNVKFAGKLCHGTILMPGDEFSYWSMIAPCTEAQGFLPAPTYLNGQTVDGIGGGICQISSSIYTAAFQANLEILERRPHTYSVGYLPDGSDAMVSGGSSDFRFKNNTEYPIQIVVKTNGRNLTVQILGTKTDGIYARLESVRVSTTPYETIYKADPSIPVGTTQESVSPYTGRKVEAYRCIYNAEGQLLSRTLESVNNYRKRDRIILCNPADLHLYDPTVAPPSPSLSPAPEPSTNPEVSPLPSASLPTVTTPPPAQPSAEAPAESSHPEVSHPPASPSATPTPTPTETPAEIPPEAGAESE